ncbi:hypothetical protein KVV02_008115 [Mortierella alpina]|uniref:Uncharacterized protein n=1 Tax=Mortierella alpina TaxID=64518 RepID=A0A9P8A7H1_MORAP|nr:hypothetical protein KVV02_008115 [Mortierella alpina]
MLSTTSAIVQLAKAPFKRAQRGLFGGMPMTLPIQRQTLLSGQSYPGSTFHSQVNQLNEHFAKEAAGASIGHFMLDALILNTEGHSLTGAMTKTRRTWLPNVQTKRLFSETLNDWIRLNMTTSVIRTVDKKGGLDRYLLETRPDLLGAKGVELRGKIVEALKAKQARKAMATFSQQQQINTTTLSSEASQAVKVATNPATPTINAASTTSQATSSL